MFLLVWFGGSVDTKYVSLNNQPCIARTVLIDLNPAEFHYYLFTVTLECWNKYIQYDNRSEGIKNINKTYFM